MGRRRRRPRRAELVLALVAIASLVGVADASAVRLPPGFQDEVFLEAKGSGREHPSAFKFAGDGRTFVATKGGKILIYPPGATKASEAVVFADLAEPTYDNGDHGLLGLALDPRFEAGRPYVYALYTFNHELGLPPDVAMPAYPSAGKGSSAFEGDSCPRENNCLVSGRLVRLQAEGNHAVPRASEPQEEVLLEGWCQQSSSHSIGDLGFGPEGALFVSGGEGAIWNNPDYGQYENLCGDPNGVKGTPIAPNPPNPRAEGGALRSQSPLRPNGQVLLNGTLDRIDPDTGEGWPGNPYAGDLNANKRRIVAFGFRNPFRFAVSPQLGEVFVGNVGANKDEEVDRVPIGGPIYNSGWPCYEGGGPNVEFQVLDLDACNRLYEAPGSTAMPFFYYLHTTAVAPSDECRHNSGSAISGAAFAEGTAYPAEYEGAYFFADSVRGCIYVMLADDADHEPDPASLRPFLSEGSNYPGVDLEQGPDGSIYYASLYGGTIDRISYDSQVPTARLITTGDPWGDVPLEVGLDASASTGPPGDPLIYEWDLDGDGEFDDGSGAPTQQATYADGSKNVTAAVRVQDERTGKSSIARQVVYPGDSPPAVTITSPEPALTWGVGQQLHFAGGAVAQGGAGAALPESALYWKTRLLHCPFNPSDCHEHPIQIFPATAEGTIEAPDHAYPSYVNFILTATDARGLEGEATVKVAARPVALQIASEPPGVEIGVGETTVSAPGEFDAIEGSRTEVAAPDRATIGGFACTFERWSDGGPRVHEAPTDRPGTYTAIYGGIGCSGALGAGGGSAEGGTEGGGAGQSPGTEGSTGQGPGRGVSPARRSGHAGLDRPRLVHRPARRDFSPVARFVFVGDAGSSFRCKLDRGEFVPCRSPWVYRHLGLGPHVLRVFASNAAGTRSVATVFGWQVLPKGGG